MIRHGVDNHLKKKTTTNNENAACKDGNAATGFVISLPRSNTFDTVESPILPHPRAVIRAIWAMYPSRAAIHGGATGNKM
ncbi:unannotated protein [freshwater metagenome]|uniref:Unannotated protein n=1 Tax=freshwater metagenome TaxID=449393 RepID=A0A6J6AW19_9ZZZZ